MNETRDDAMVRLVEDAYGTHGHEEAPTVMYLAREVVTLRAQLAAARERVEKLPRYANDGRGAMMGYEDGTWVSISDVLAALEVGG